MDSTESFRAQCLRCLRPESTCFCQRLQSLPTKTRVVFLQHPRERRVAIGTARMAHLQLPNSELHSGVSFDSNARVQALADDPRAAILFPSGDAVAPDALPGGRPDTLVVIDGTWSQARKVLKKNPVLSKLPRVALKPEKPGNYRIRKEPAPDFLSTIEAVAEILGALEGDKPRFKAMLQSFDFMVENQLGYAQLRPGARRIRIRRDKNRRSEIPVELVDRWEDIVLLYAEANAYTPCDVGIPAFKPELVQLLGVRPSTGERFEAFIKPQQPLGPNTVAHIEVGEDVLLRGGSAEEAYARWQTFTGENPVVCAWAFFALDLLSGVSGQRPTAVDLRRATARLLKRRPGGLEQAVAALGGEVLPQLGTGRGGRRLGALLAVTETLRVRAQADAAKKAARAALPPTDEDDEENSAAGPSSDEAAEE